MDNIKDQISTEINKICNIYPSFKQIPPDAIERLSLRLSDLFHEMNGKREKKPSTRMVEYNVNFDVIMPNNDIININKSHIAPEHFDCLSDFDIIKDILGSTNEFNVINGQYPYSFVLRHYEEVDNTIEATCYSSDMEFEVDFDAQDYFYQANDNDLLHLLMNGCTNFIYADNVVKYEAQNNVQIQKMLNYIEKKNIDNIPIGFECYINPRDALSWVIKFRKNVYEMFTSHH